MNSAWFQPHPASQLMALHTSRRNRKQLSWYPLLMLVWTFWIVATPYFDPRTSFVNMVPTYVSLAVFLVLYYIAYMWDRRYTIYAAFGIALLGFVITPTNPGAQGYLIYFCAFIGLCGPVRQMLAVMAATLALYIAESRYLGCPWMYPLSTALVGTVVALMSIYYRRNAEMDTELKLSHDEVRRLAATAERERIGRDLHDLLGHTLSLIALKSELANRLWERDQHAARREVQDVERVARDALAQVRRAVTGIRAAGMAAELASARLLLESGGVAFRYELADAALPVEVETALALVLREALTNVHRHARASVASVTSAVVDAHLVVEVCDNGRGGDLVPGNGLIGMRERLTGLGAELAIDSARDAGTRLKIRVPLPRGDGTAPAPAPSRLQMNVAS